MADIAWLKDDGTLEDGWRDNALPQDIRAEPSLADFKSIGAIAKAFVDTKKALGGMAKIPTEPAERRKFMAEHFKPELEADETARKGAADKARAESDEAARVRAEESARQLKETHGAKFETNLELVRRAFRSNHAPQWIKDGIAAAAKVELDKLTDDQIKSVVQTDPAVFETLLAIGNLTKDGRTETGDGHVSDKVTERLPAYPHKPDVYEKEPDTNPEKLWFINRGARYEGGRYVGGFGQTGP